MSFLDNVVSSAKSLGGSAYLAGMKYGPHALVIGGVVGVGVSMFMVGKASTRLDDVVKNGDKKIAKAHKNYDKIKADPENYEQLTEDEFKKELLVLHTKKWFDVVKLYAPAAGVAVLSLAAILGSHKILTDRNAALVAAYEALNLSYKKYRQNVEFEFGKTADSLMRNGEIITDTSPDEGDMVALSETKKGITEGNPYGVWFSKDTSVQFRADPIHNLNFLLFVENHMNQRLHAYGFVFLNEVLQDLGMQRTSVGSVVGWSLKAKGDGMDHFIDFGLNDPVNNMFRAEAVNEAFLNFNVNGDMHELV